jgi:hypothetical protein
MLAPQLTLRLSFVPCLKTQQQGLQARLAAMSEQQLRQKLVQLMARLGPMQAEIKVRAAAAGPAAVVAAQQQQQASSSTRQIGQLYCAPTKPAVALWELRTLRCAYNCIVQLPGTQHSRACRF